VILQPLDRGERGANAEIVGDLAVLEGDVEVGAYQHALAINRREVFEMRERHSRYFSLAPRISVMSTSRFE
jgi:hypothetical protein